MFLSLGLACSYRNTRIAENSSPALQSPNTDSLEPARSLPSPQGLVNDFAGVIDDETQNKLEAKLAQFKSKSSIEFAVVTIETTGGQPIFDYSLALARQWKVGPKDLSGGGLLYLVAVKDREWRIQVSRSLEKDLPDDVCKTLASRSVELFQQKKYGDGIANYVDSIIERLDKARTTQVSLSN